MAHERVTLPPGARELTAEYRFRRELGRGGTAVVYLADDRELGRAVAIKLVRAPLATDDESLQRLAHEARVAALLEHPNIVGIHAVRRLRDGTLALVMQYVPGRTLKQAILQDGMFPVTRAEQVLADVAAGLAYAHERGVIHRDVKPENVFLDERTGRALLADFGIARADPGGSGLTLAGVAIGTPAYMAPERIDGSAEDPRSDLYSLALLAWEMLTGEAPWEGESLYQVLYKQRHEPLPSVRRLRPDVPFHLWYIIERCLQKHPERRFASAHEVLETLQCMRAAPPWRRWLAAWRLGRIVAPAAPAPQLPAGDAAWQADPGEHTIRWPRSAAAAAEDAAAPVAAATAAASPSLRDVVGAVWSRWRGRLSLLPSLRRLAVQAGPWSVTRIRPLVTGAALVLLAGLGAAVYAITQHTPPASAAGGPPALLESAPPPLQRAGLGAPAPAFAISLPVEEAEATAPDAAADTAPAPPAQRDTSDTQAATVEPPPTSALDRPPGEATRAAAADLAPADAPAQPSATEPAVPPAPAGAEPARAEPVAAARFASTVAGGMHSCTLTSAGEVFCWGGNSTGQLGNGRTTRSQAPERVDGGPRFRDIAAGVAHTCALSTGGEAFCWGGNESGQLGDGSAAARTTPARVAGGRAFASLHAGRSHSCGLTRRGEVFCWGANDYGQLGDGSRTPRRLPVRSGDLTFEEVATGWNHTCAVTRRGETFCWGQNADGQLGTGDLADSPTPRLAGGGRAFARLAAGGAHTCALAAGGAAFCWGRNQHGQLGDGTAVSRSQPVPVAGGITFASLTAGGAHTCGLTPGGEAFCWGRNAYGQLGDGTTTDRAAPVRVEGGLRFRRLHASGAHTCAITRQGEQFCWGYNVEGQVGDGSRSHQTRPVRVPVLAG